MSMATRSKSTTSTARCCEWSHAHAPARLPGLSRAGGSPERQEALDAPAQECGRRPATRPGVRRGQRPLSRYPRGGAHRHRRGRSGPVGLSTGHQKGRRHRALNPWAPHDAALLETIARGEWTLSGFRNRDVRAALHGATSDLVERKRRAARVTRGLALLRAHRVILKVTGTHRYMVTRRGREIITAILSARQASVAQLLRPLE